MNNPLIDQRHFEKKPWRRELMWVQRNALGHIVGIEEKMPETMSANLDLPKDIKSRKEIQNDLPKARRDMVGDIRNGSR